MHQHLVLKGVVRFLCSPKSIRLLGSFFLCALVFSLFCPLFGQEKVIQRVTAPIQSVFSQPPKSLPQVNSNLPGLGTLPDGPVSTSPPVFAGSLELLPPQTVYQPSIYVEGQGYVPLTHPSIQPYIDPALLRDPASDPAIVMIPTQVSRQMETTKTTTLSLPSEKEAEPIVISAQTGWSKRIGNSDVYFLRGDCSLRQGKTAAHSLEAVVWITVDGNLREVTYYLEGETVHQQGAAKITDQKWLGHWYSRTAVDVMIAQRSLEEDSPPQEEPAIFKRAIARLAPAETSASGEGIVQTQFLSSTAIPQLPEGVDLGFRSVQLNPRGDGAFGFTFVPYNPNDQASGGIVVLTGGINMVIEGISPDKITILSGDTVDISADNAVIWTENPGKIQGGASFTESDKTDFEIYLEGNIIYRDGPRVIEASRMYYDVKHRIAYILHGHLSAPISEITGVEGSVRLKAEILRQMGDGLFTARNAMVTTSQLGEPTYSIRSQSLRFDRRITPGFADTDAKLRQVIVAENNYVAVRNVPVFYWPWMATDVETPTFYLKNLSYGTNRRFGHTVKTLWDPFQILNIRRPDGVDGDVIVTWMEKRGVGHGANFKYGVNSFCHIPGPAKGTFDYWGIYDHGRDKLGGERKNLEYPNQYRYRLHWIHQQQIDMHVPVVGGPWDFRAEVGKVSDRNFLNSYYNPLWHTQENATTALDLTHRDGNKSLNLSVEYALDNFYTSANWLPRLDHYWLGESLFNDYLTWYEHTRVGLMDYRPAHAANDPSDPIIHEFLPWEDGAKGTGVVFSTRHELDLPVQAGPVKIVPYVLGDLSAWGTNQDGKAVERFYGQGGVRMNLPIWKVEPRVSSRTWYLNGLAHKIDLDAEYLYAGASRSMDNLILTDPLDLWSIDDFRRRYLTTNPNFGGVMSEKFDPRYYALRSGMASNVTAGNMEIADDMQMFRFGVTQRFQTKRGSVGKRHILDWITVSTHLNLYPQAEYNFGKNIGLLDYNVLWHVGDRFSLFSEGLYDVFEQGQKLTRFGGVWNRPDRGSFSLMLDQFSGVVERTYLSLSVGYTMNEKYSMSYLTSYDVRGGQNVGHNFMFVRTGESFRLLVGAVYSEALSEWSFSVGLEPVFLRRAKQRGVVAY